MNCRGSLDPAGSLNTLPVLISGKECPFQTRYVFAYGMDNSDRPSYLLWPIRGGNGQFLLVDPWSGNYFDLEAAKFVKPIGIEHFFDAFSLEKKRPLKIDAASALNIQVKDVSDSLVVNQDKAKRFELTPVWAPAEPPAKRAKTAEVRLSSASNVPRPPKSDENEKGTGEAPPELRTIHVIFADPILVAMECVPVSSSSDLKQDVRSCVRSVKIQKLYETFVVSHQ